jgi:hypothetical protein
MDGPDEAVVMPFGKYKGRVVADIPEDYLEWFADNVKTKPALAEAVAKALGRTGQPQKSQTQTSPSQKSRSVPSLTLTGSGYVPSNDTSCPFDCD